MQRVRPFRTTALCLITLSGGLSTGLPSHHHQDAGHGESRARLVPADHHSHGTGLVEQDERAPSSTPEMVAAVASDVELSAPTFVAAAPAADRPIRPTERAPPPGEARAPPLPT